MKHVQQWAIIMIAFSSYCMHLTGSQPAPGVCYIHGDRHLIPFAKRPGEDSAQYRCEYNGDQTILSNRYVQGTISVRTSPSWNEDRSFSSLDIYYRYSSTRDLRIVINTYDIAAGGSAYDIQIMQLNSLIRRSSGLCTTYNDTCSLENSVHGSKRRTFTATPAAYVCGGFLNEVYNKSKEFNIPISQISASHAKAACIKDLRIHNNIAFAKSTIAFLLYDSLYRKTKNNVLYGKQSYEIFQAIQQATDNAYQEAMIILPNPTTDLS
ncbi:unnamed protein product [Adineta steineri]|uniref:Uncharacterized protein n=1 Tax=Adineta steineri TaxID=433720 RepID=A0A814FLP5_9BILA|nr:unnamed protein product [Adineta steineri]CAF1148079.1 unnamed protein product [Adineta steineri]CAF1156368.1 unnamed protein product [Adineta steineri]